MNTSEHKAIQANIGAAFEVVRQTYFNLEKFFRQLDEAAGKAHYTTLVQSKPGFLRWKSDADPWGWQLSNFIKLYRHKSNGEPSSEAPSAAPQILGIEVDLQKLEGPVLRTIRYEYEANRVIEENIAVSLHWQYYWPMRSTGDFTINELGQEGISTAVPKNDAAKTKYRGLVKVSWKTCDLVGITQHDVEGLVRGFDLEWPS
jgi:hypothetical protein